MSPQQNPYRFVDRIPADAERIIHLGDGRALAEAFALLNPDCRWEDWSAARDLPPGSVDAVVIERPLPGGAAAQAILRRSVALLKEGGTVLVHARSAHFHQLLADRLAGRPVPDDAHAPEDVVACLRSAGAAMTAMVLSRGDGEAAGRFAARHPDVAARLGGDEERRLRHLASPNFLVQAVRGPLPAPVYIYARLPNSAFGANRAMADVRVARPLQFFGAIPNVHIWVSRDPEPMRPPVRPDGIFLYQRPILRRPHAIDLLRQLVQRRYVVVLEFDDHPNHWADIAAHDHLTFAGVHAVQTSTEPLAEVLRQHNPNVEVFRNHVAELPPRAERPAPTDERPLRIFYGSLNRMESMRPLIEAVNRVLASAPVPVHVSVVADRNFHDQLRTARKDFAEMVSHERHRQMVSEADIVLLPLADTTFNRCKSDLSFVEAAARGAVVLASPIVYAGTVEDGRTGMIFRSAGEFEAKLDRLVRDPALRSEIAGNAYDYVRRNRLQKDAFRRRWRWYRSLLDRKEELDRGLRERIPEFRDL